MSKLGITLEHEKFCNGCACLYYKYSTDPDDMRGTWMCSRYDSYIQVGHKEDVRVARLMHCSFEKSSLRKVIQMSIYEINAGSSGRITIIRALCDDGTMWEQNLSSAECEWYSVSDVPQGEIE